MNRWARRVIVFLLAAVAGYYATLAATPYVLMELAIRRVTERGPFNSFTHAAPVRAELRTIVRPSPDLLYSSCPFDLSDGPVRVTAAPIPGHYSSISIFDARTDTVFVANDEDMAGRQLNVIVALHGQQTPPGAPVVRVTLARGIVLQRVLLSDPRDPVELASVDPIRRMARCEPVARSAD